jgi:hypothetical protein
LRASGRPWLGLRFELQKAQQARHEVGAWIRPCTGIDDEHNQVFVHQPSAIYSTQKSRENGKIRPENIGCSYKAATQIFELAVDPAEALKQYKRQYVNTAVMACFLPAFLAKVLTTNYLSFFRYCGIFGSKYITDLI